MSFELYKRSGSPKWQARLKMPDGEVIRISCKTSNEELARAYAQEQWDERKWRVKLGLTLKTATFGEMYKACYENWQSPKAEDYRRLYHRHIEPEFRDTPVDQITKERIINHVMRANPSPSQQNKLLVMFDRTLKYAAGEQMLPEAKLPNLQRVKLDYDPRDAFTNEEMEVILSHFKSKLEYSNRYRVNDKWRATYYHTIAMYATGCRPGKELENARWSDIIPAGGENRRHYNINIHAENTKVQRDRQVVADYIFNDKIMVEYKRWQEGWGIWKPDGYLFVDRYGGHLNTFWHSFVRCIEEAGVLYSLRGKRRSPYSIRHLYATNKLLRNASAHVVARQMGTSTKMIDHTYSKVIAAMASEVLLE